MFTSKPITSSTQDDSIQVNRLRRELESAPAILIGAGSGLSASAGLTYDGVRFQEHFADFIARYQLRDMYSAGFYPYQTREEYWAYWSRHIYCNRYDRPAGKPYLDLLELVRHRDYFVITTNVDHQFQIAGFDKQRLFYTQGDYGLWQCSVPCHQKTYDNEQTVRRMLAEQTDMRVPQALVPFCPQCGSPMTMNLRCDHSFVQDEGWYRAYDRYEAFVHAHENTRVLLLELGVGANTPGIIKYPFWLMAAHNANAVYACINLGEAVCPEELEPQAICIHDDIGTTLERIRHSPQG